MDVREAAAEAPETKSARKPARRVELEDELAEGDLLGQSTLAKLNVTREDEKPAEETASASVAAAKPEAEKPASAE
jgi:hypothetical protein